MKNRKMKADSVDQLFEIVKAVQQGQDPEEMLRKKQAESAPLADSPKSNPEIKSELPGKERKSGKKDADKEAAKEEKAVWEMETAKEEKAVREIETAKGEKAVREMETAKEEKAAREMETAKEEKAVWKMETADADDGWDDNDDFMQILNDDGPGELDVSAITKGLNRGFQKLSGLFAKLQKSEEKKPGTKAKRSRHIHTTEDSGQETTDPKLTGKDAKKAEPEQAEKKGEKAGPELTEKDAKKAEPEQAEKKGEKAGLELTEKDAKKVEPEQAEKKGEKAGLELTKKEPQNAEPELTEEELREKSEDAKTIDRLLEIPSTETDSGSSRKAEENELAAKPRKGGLRESEGKKSSVNIGDFFDDIWDRVLDFKDYLSRKGINRRELIMIAAGVLLAILVVFMAVRGFQTSSENKKKSENVTADTGFTITVEKEPQQWCQSYPVSLKCKVKGSTVQKVTIDGAIYEPDENGIVTVRARDYLLQASVETEEGTLNAQIEIPMIDAQVPVVHGSREQDMITLTAADGRSGIKKIWYAAVHDNDYLQIPGYQEYSEPFRYEPDTMYYFYAEDMAGNRSVPVNTTMEQAEEIILESSELCLFPGETAYLCVDGNPSGSLLNDLSFESMNTSVATVDSTGLVTALAEGATVIKVNAEGLDEVSCAVEVSRERTVTISAVGDCTLGSDEAFNTNTNFQAFATVNSYSYFFHNVSSIFENDDATFANFEGVLTTETTREAKEYAFKGKPEYTEILQEGSIEVVTLANNHSSDYGEQSLKDTKQYLSGAGIDYCTGDTIAYQEIKGIKTAFIGIYVLYDGMEREEQVRQTIASARAQGAQLVIVAFHWGSEKATQPDEIQTSLAHIAVDCGADLVVGHHPHVLQGIEKYNGKYIVYSLGNFCFGGNSAPSDMDTIIFRQTFTIRDGSVQDDDQIEIIPCSISSTSGYNNYQPTPVTGTEAERIIGRVNEYSSAYGQTYTASTVQE